MYIASALAGGTTPAFSFEFFPPRTEDAARQLEQTIAALRDLAPAFVSVTYGAGGSTRDQTIDIVTRIKRDTGIEAMAHLSCAGSTRDELDAVLGRLDQAGVENVLALRGDPPKGETSFRPVDGGFRYASELVRFIRDRHHNRFCLGGAAYPEKHIECGNPAVDLMNLKRKTQEGVDFLVTQLFFDNQRYFDFVERARKNGITQPIVPGIMPITNASSIERMTNGCGASLPFDLAEELDRRRSDPAAVLQLGIEHAITQCVGLLKGGAPGIHFYTLTRSHATVEILQSVRKTL